MKARKPDYPLIIAVFVLIVLGLIILASASVVVSQNNFNQSYYYLKHQLFYSIPLGLICFLIFQKIHYKKWQKLAFPLLIFSLILLGLVFVPGLGYSHGQTKRWLSLSQFSFQPFEFVKITFILYLSALLSKKKESDERAIKESLIPLLIVLIAISALVVLQPNMSALIFLFLIVCSLYFLTGLKLSRIFIILFVFAVACFALIKISPYRTNRLTVFLHPEIDPQGVGYQINQALMAIGSGGLWGLGLGHSIQKWKYLPEVIGDSIFAIAAEEFGFIGAAVIIILFIFLIWRGFLIAKKAPDKFGYLAAGGIVSWLFLQVFINIAAISGLIPLTGMPLPFISYGGSAMVASLIGIGILVNISKFTTR